MKPLSDEWDDLVKMIRAHNPSFPNEALAILRCAFATGAHAVVTVMDRARQLPQPYSTTVVSDMLGDLSDFTTGSIVEAARTIMTPATGASSKPS